MARDQQQPAYRVFTVEKREGQDDFWLAIGAAFPHQDGKGFNIIFQAHPIGNKIVLREPQAEQEPERQPDRNNRREERRPRGR